MYDLLFLSGRRFFFDPTWLFTSRGPLIGVGEKLE